APSPKAAASPAASSDADPNGPANRRTDVARRGLLYHETDAAYGHPEGDDGFTGSVFWRSNENGFTVTVRGHEAAMQLTEDVIEAEAFADVPAALRAATTFDRKAATVVRITPNQGVP